MYRRCVDRRDERTSRTALRLAVITLAMASCTARYTYLVPAAQIARSHVAEGSFITLRTSRDEDRNVVIDALRSATPGVGDVTVYAAQRTWAPTAGLIPGAFLGAGFGALLVGTRCLEGCTDTALATLTGAAIFSLVGAVLGWCVGGLVALIRTTPQRAVIVYPSE